MFSQVAKLVGLDFVFVNRSVGARNHSARKAGSFLADFSLPKKIRAFDGSNFISRFENHPVAKIQRQHLRLFLAQRRNERRGRLRGGNQRRLCFAHHVNAIVIAHAVFAGRDKALRFVRPQDD